MKEREIERNIPYSRCQLNSIERMIDMEYLHLATFLVLRSCHWILVD